MLDADHPLTSRVVSTAKVIHYLLNPSVSEGSDKAKFFLSFGFRVGDYQKLATALYDHPEHASFIGTWSDRWGTRYNVVGPLRSPDGRSPTILTGWIEDGRGPARLVTAFPA